VIAQAPSAVVACQSRLWHPKWTFAFAIAAFAGTVMANLDDSPPPAVGVFWIKEEDYPALLRIFDDGNKMPRTWKEWLKIAEEMERGLKAYGHPVMRVTIDPNTFPLWCAAHGTSPGGEGRKRFIAAAVKERYGDNN
jgi:hypothetical protein